MLVRVKVTAGARRERFVELMEHSYEIHVKEEAERNEANNRVRTLIARHFHVLENAVSIVSGHQRPNKTFRVIK